MIGSVRVTDGRRRICTVNNEPLYLGSLALMLSCAASHATAETGMNIARLYAFFADSEQWPRVDVPPDASPDYPVSAIDETNNFALHCETWGIGVIEIFRKNDEFTHVGFQLSIRPALFRTKRRQKQSVGEVVSAAKESYGAPVSYSPAEGPDSAALFFRDETTVCFVESAGRPIESAGRPIPLITYRIWNRRMWDPDLTAIESA